MNIEKIAAQFSRNLYLFPGGYFLVIAIKKLFAPKRPTEPIREFEFRGMRMKVDISKSMGESIYWRGAHDWRPIFVLDRYLKFGQTFIDVGANQGEYSIWAARKVAPSGSVIAFEPMDTLYKQLNENMRLNPFHNQLFKSLKIGLSDKPGEMNLYGKASSNEGVNTMFPTAEHTELIQKIPLDTLDSQLEKLACKQVDFIKIDVEGAELQVLKGATETLVKHKPLLLIEVNEEASQAAGYTSDDILVFLRSFGYQFHEIGLRGRLKSIENIGLSFCNILATPK